MLSPLEQFTITKCLDFFIIDSDLLFPATANQFSDVISDGEYTTIDPRCPFHEEALPINFLSELDVLFPVFFLFFFFFFSIGLTYAKIGFSNPIQNFIIFIWNTLSGIVRQQLEEEQRFTPIFIWSFLWIAFHNVMGLVPFNLTLTAHLSATLFLSLGFNLGFLIWGLFHHQMKFFSLFVPKGAPLFLLPLIVLIEVISYCIRPVSLALRLFANMMAGHTLVHILLSFLAGANFTGFFIGSAAILAVTLLEFGIALLQAYVFLVLSCIYLRDALEPSH